VSWLNLLTPSAAIIAIFLALALVVQSFRHGRQIRRLEQQIASAGLTAYDPSLQRLKTLSGLSESKPAGSEAGRQPIASRRTQIVVAGVVGALIVAGVAWIVVARNSSSSKARASAKPTTHTATTHTATSTGTTTTTRPAAALTCANATPVSSPSATTVSVYNGSGVVGAAGKVVGPKLSSVGYTLGTVGNAPTGVPNAAVSSIQYVTKSDLDAACGVATALGVAARHVTSLTLLPASQAGNAGVIVLVGRDIAYG
jgi:LytR cell envelope-related transcriptional attenuator